MTSTAPWLPVAAGPPGATARRLPADAGRFRPVPAIGNGAGAEPGGAGEGEPCVAPEGELGGELEGESRKGRARGRAGRRAGFVREGRERGPVVAPEGEGPGRRAPRRKGSGRGRRAPPSWRPPRPPSPPPSRTRRTTPFALRRSGERVSGGASCRVSCRGAGGCPASVGHGSVILRAVPSARPWPPPSRQLTPVPREFPHAREPGTRVPPRRSRRADRPRPAPSSGPCRKGRLPAVAGLSGPHG